MNANQESKFSLIRQKITPLKLTSLLFFILLSLLIKFGTKEESNLRENDRTRFKRLTDKIQNEIERRVNLYKYGLMGSRSLFIANGEVTRNEFKRMVESRELEREFPGSLGIGYIAKLPDEEVIINDFVRKLKQEGSEDYEIKFPPSKLDPKKTKTNFRMIVKYIFPVEPNKNSEGLDIGADPTRREAAEKAMIAGAEVISASIQLVQSLKTEKGFLILLPIYSSDKEIVTEQDRINSIKGWVFMPLVASGIMKGVAEFVEQELDFEIFDGRLPDIDNLLYDDDGHLLKKHADKNDYERNLTETRHINIAGRSWLIATYNTPKYKFYSRKSVWFIYAGGGILILFACYLVWFQSSNLSRVSGLAESMIQDYKRLALVAEKTSNAVVILGPDRSISWINKGFSEILGFNLDEIKGVSFNFFLANNKFTESSVKDFHDALLKGSSVNIRLAYCSKNYSQYWLDTDLQPLYDDLNILTGFFVILSDVTEQVKTNEKLEKALTETRTLTEAINKFMIVSVADSNGKIIEVNDTFCTVSGFSREELIGKDHAIVNSGKHNKEFWVNTWKVIGSGKPWRNEVCNKRKDGSIYWVDSMIIPFVNRKGRIEKFISARFDITPRKKTEAELIKAKQDAQQASKTKSEFLANMSHEIRTPMNGIIGMTDLLLDTTLDDSQKELAVTVKDSAHSLLTVINDILDFSKIEAGKLEIVKERFDIRQLLGRLEALFNYKVEEKEISFISEIDRQVPRFLIGDPGRINQVLVNLIGNSLKFTDQSGAVIVKVALSEITDVVCRLTFSVIDTGIGMSDSAISNIFQAFSQADNSITRRFGGTGLGLSISLQLVRLMGGIIEVASKEGVGSVFRFALSFEISQNEAQITEELNVTEEEIETRPLKILLAEDNVVNQKVVIKILEKSGHEISVASSGKEAVEVFEKSTFDIILMDIQMPEMNGLEAASLIKKSAKGNKIPIIALTAHAMSGDREKYIASGMDGYVTKPIDRKKLFSAIKACLGKFD